MTNLHAASPGLEGAVNRLLEREPPEGYRTEWTRHLAEGKTENVAELRSCVVFRVGDSLLALPTPIVEVVLEDCAFHTIPQHRSKIPVTVANVRGELLVCVSLEALLGLGSPPSKTSGSRNVYRHLIACRRRDDRFAFPIDEAQGVEHYRTNEVSDVPSTLAGNAANYTRGLLLIRNRTIGLVDEDRLFAALRRNAL